MIVKDVLNTNLELQRGFKITERLQLNFCGFQFAVRNVLNIKDI